jgi:hypothetical protein
MKAILEHYGIKTLLVQNGKMKKSSGGGVTLYNFGIPALKSESGLLTCPNAKQCAVGCYARMGSYCFSNVKNAYENRLLLTQDSLFESVIIEAINKLLKKHESDQLLIRVHDSGDFYSPAYQIKWYNIAKSFENNKKVQFYSYTKMVSQSEKLEKPNNFTLIYSLGGTEDNLVNCETMRHSKVFETESALILTGYVNASSDDTIALGLNNKIGLVYHGNKNYANTKR